MTVLVIDKSVNTSIWSHGTFLFVSVIESHFITNKFYYKYISWGNMMSHRHKWSDICGQGWGKLINISQQSMGMWSLSVQASIIIRAVTTCYSGSGNIYRVIHIRVTEAGFTRHRREGRLWELVMQQWHNYILTDFPVIIGSWQVVVWSYNNNYTVTL